MATNDTLPAPEAAAPIGRRYNTVEAMLLGEGASEQFTQQFSEVADATRVTRVLAQLRAAHGLTQKEMGERIGISQGAVSKLESGRDEELKLSEVCAYARSLNERIGVLYGPQPNHVEAINLYLGRMKYHMLELAKVSRADAEMDSRMNKFFGDTFQNVMELLACVYTNLPNGIKGCEFTKEVIYTRASTSCDPSQGLSTRRRELAEV